tara:strand:- start:3672 stop:6497 length:2826 start_codon:yes stop_codon:yes gene_type:complete
MGRIKVHTADDSPGAVANPALSKVKFTADDFGAGLSKPIEQFGEMMQKSKDFKDKTWANKQLAQFDQDMIADVKQLELSVEADGEGHTQNIKDHTAWKTKEILDAAPTPEIRALLEARLSRATTQHIATATAVQSKMFGMSVAKTSKETNDQRANNVRANPDTWEETRGNVSIDVDVLGLDARRAEALIKDNLAVVDYNGALGEINAAEREEDIDDLIAEMGEKDNIFSKRLGAKDFGSLYIHAQNKRLSIISKASADEQNAKANVAVGLLNEYARVENGVLAGELPESDLDALKTRVDAMGESRTTASVLQGIGATKRSLIVQNGTGAKKAAKDAARVERAFEVLDAAQEAKNGGLDKRELDEMRTEGYFKTDRGNLEYKEILRGIDTYDRLQQAIEDNDADEVTRLTKIANKFDEKAAETELDFQRFQMIRDASVGDKTIEELTANKALLGPRGYDRALKARQKFDLLTEKEKEKAQKIKDAWVLVDVFEAIREATTEEELEEIKDQAKQLRDNGRITPGGYDSVNAKLAAPFRRAFARRRSFETFSRAFVDEKFSVVISDLGANEKAHYDEWFGIQSKIIQETAAQEMENEPDIRKRAHIAEKSLQATVDIMKKVGGIPRSISQGIKKGLSPGAQPEQAIASADMIARIRKAHPGFAGEFSSSEFSLGMGINVLISNGMNPKTAYEQEMKNRQAEGEVGRDIRKKNWYTELSKDKGTRSDKGNNILHKWLYAAAKEINDTEDDPRWADALDGIKPENLPPAFVAAFHEFASNHYANSGGTEMAKKDAGRIALAWMSGTWGKSYFGNPDGKLSLRPPELMYGVPNLTPKENAEWQKEQLISDMSKGSPMYGTGWKQRVRLITHPSRSNEGRPTYIISVRGTDNKIHTLPMPWSPNFDTSPHKKRLSALLEKRKQEHREGRKSAGEKLQDEAGALYRGLR